MLIKGRNKWKELKIINLDKIGYISFGFFDGGIKIDFEQEEDNWHSIEIPYKNEELKVKFAEEVLDRICGENHLKSGYIDLTPEGETVRNIIEWVQRTDEIEKMQQDLEKE